MEAHDVPVTVTASPVVFETSKAFKADNEWRLERKHKFKPKTREFIAGIFAQPTDVAGSDYQECIEKLLDEEIDYSDLASLSDADLQMFGFKYPRQRQEMLSFVSQLPNQEPTYEQICKQPQAERYNGKILMRAKDHLNKMCSALNSSNLKLQLDPPDDVIVGDKYFATRFVLEALAEVNSATDEIDKELQQLEQLLSDGNKNPVKWPERKSSLAAKHVFVLLSLTSATLVILGVLKFKKLI